MTRKWLVLIPVLILLAVPAALFALQATPQFQCLFFSGYATEINPGHYALDLQCQPIVAETMTIPVGEVRTFTINLSAYYTATGRTTAEFVIHLAMDRARLVLRQPDSLEGTLVTDTFEAIRDVPITTNAQSYTFLVTNEGLRSAVFDLSVRPR